MPLCCTSLPHELAKQRIVRPVQQRLPRNRRERSIVQLFAMPFAQLHEHSDMSPITSPALNLPLVVFAAPTERVAAIPLKPAERITRAQPTLLLPLAK